MRRVGFAEWLLKHAAGEGRSTTIYGDLVELAATRGRAWFWTAYARTLVSCCWRTPVAFACGLAAFQLLAWLIEFWIAHMPGAWRDHLMPLLVSAGPALSAVTVTLWIGLPYLMVRYGVRDRVVQLTAALFVLDTAAFLYVPWLSFLCAVGAGVLVLASLCSRRWRRTGAMAIAMVVGGAASFAGAMGAMALGMQYLSEQMHPGRLTYRAHIPWMVWDAAVLAAMLAISGVCWFSQRRPAARSVGVV